MIAVLYKRLVQCRLPFAVKRRKRKGATLSVAVWREHHFNPSESLLKLVQGARLRKIKLISMEGQWPRDHCDVRKLRWMAVRGACVEEQWRTGGTQDAGINKCPDRKPETSREIRVEWSRREVTSVADGTIWRREAWKTARGVSAETEKSSLLCSRQSMITRSFFFSAPARHYAKHVNSHFYVYSISLFCWLIFSRPLVTLFRNAIHQSVTFWVLSHTGTTGCHLMAVRCQPPPPAYGVSALVDPYQQQFSRCNMLSLSGGSCMKYCRANKISTFTRHFSYHFFHLCFFLFPWV